MYGAKACADAFCGNCGEYRKNAELHTGKRGDKRCNFCGQQVALKPLPSRVNHRLRMHGNVAKTYI